MSTLAIIPARGGSKRIPHKNIKEFFGKPIIQYSIEAALESNIFDEVMVSTDSTQISDVALKCGAKVPFLRSVENSADQSTLASSVKEVLEEYKRQGKEFESVCVLFSTAPFVNVEKIKKSFEILKTENFDSVITITSFSFPIERAFQKKGKKISYCQPEFRNTMSQDLETKYHDCGQLFWIKPDIFLSSGEIVTENTGGFLVPEQEVQDIDNVSDWEIAEIKYQAMIKKN